MFFGTCGRKVGTSDGLPYLEAPTVEGCGSSSFVDGASSNPNDDLDERSDLRETVRSPSPSFSASEDPKDRLLSSFLRFLGPSCSLSALFFVSSVELTLLNCSVIREYRPLSERKS